MLLKQIEECEDETQQVKLNILMEIVLNICAQIIKVNIRGQEEFAHVLSELGIDQATQAEVVKVFKMHYLDRIEAINTAYDEQDEDTVEVPQKIQKKFPLNLGVADDALAVSNPRLVDVEWKLLHTLSSKNLNKLFQPRFLITLTLLTQLGGNLQQGADCYIEWSSKRNHLKLKKLEFECDQNELRHLISQTKSACNSLEQMTKMKK